MSNSIARRLEQVADEARANGLPNCADALWAAIEEIERLQSEVNEHKSNAMTAEYLLAESEQGTDKSLDAAKRECLHFSHFTTNRDHCPECGGTWRVTEKDTK